MNFIFLYFGILFSMCVFYAFIQCILHNFHNKIDDLHIKIDDLHNKINDLNEMNKELMNQLNKK